MINSNKIQNIISLLSAEYPSAWTGMLAKSAAMFYRNLMFAIGNHIPSSAEPLYVTIPTGLLNNIELDILETSLTNSQWRITERDRDYYKVVPGNASPSKRDLVMQGRLCPYCNTKTEYRDGKWECPQCMAYVECHRGTMAAMGFVARPSLRKLRHELHKAMDALWMGGLINRGELYYKMRIKMGLTKAECHVAKFDEKLCMRAFEVLEEIKEELKNEQTTRSSAANPEASRGGDPPSGNAGAGPAGSNGANPSGDASADGAGTAGSDAGTTDATGAGSHGSGTATGPAVN